MTLASNPRTGTAYDRVLDALDHHGCAVRGHQSSRAQARCPAHDDGSPSLSITRIDGSVLIYCHAGCSIDEILDALALTKADLYDDPRGATYTYTDPQGHTTREVHRTPDKHFRQTGQTRGTAQLFRLPAVTAAVAAGQPIYLVEGEKDVLALESQGATATTSPMGSASWDKVDATPLAGAHVIIVPDRDEPGRKYAAAAYATLTELSAQVEIRLPVAGKDAADHVAAGHTLDDLTLTSLPDADADYEAQAARLRSIEKKADEIRVLEAAKALVRAERAQSTNFADAYLNRSQLLDLAAPDALIDGVLPRHAYIIVRGRDHSFKSFATIDWSLCLATGKPWMGHDVEQCRVLYIAGEGAHGLRARVDAWEYAWQRPIPPEMFTVRTTALNMHQPGPAFDHLLDHVRTGGYGLVVVDTLRRVSGAADGNSSEMGAVVDNLDRIKLATTNGSVAVVAHTDKGDHDTRGYSGIEDDADVVWAAKREDMYLDLELTKYKDGPDGTTIHLVAERTLNSLTLAETGTTSRATDTTPSQLAILDALRLIPEGNATGPELRSTAGLAKQTFYRALKDLRAAGHIVVEKRARTDYYSLPALTDDATSDYSHDPQETRGTDPQEHPHA